MPNYFILFLNFIPPWHEKFCKIGAHYRTPLSRVRILEKHQFLKFSTPNSPILHPSILQLIPFSIRKIKFFSFLRYYLQIAVL